MITRDYGTPVPLKGLRLDTNNGAELHARRTSDDLKEFEVSLTSSFSDVAWYFDLAAAQEAVEFFATLVSEMERA